MFSFVGAGYAQLSPADKARVDESTPHAAAWLSFAGYDGNNEGEYPADDVRLLTKAAVDALDRIFRLGFKYSKVEVMLLNLCQPGEYTDHLCATPQATRVMTVLDHWGNGALRSASVPADTRRGMRREMMSLSYTTKIDQLWSVVCK